MSFYQQGWDQYYTSDKNYYHGTVAGRADLAHLAGEHRCDVCIVGGGFTGLAAAYFLHRHGLRVAVLERHATGWGASGRNGGQLLPGWSIDQPKIEKKYGGDFARQVWNSSIEGIETVKAIIRDNKIDCDLAPGAAYLGFKAKHAEGLQSFVGYHQDNYGYDMQFRSGAAVAAMTGTPFYDSAAFMPQAAHLNPYKYIKGLSDALVRAGVHVFEHTPAEAVTGEEGNFTIYTPSGRVQASKVILAGNAYQGHLAPALRTKYVLARCAMIATGPLDPGIELVPANIAGCEYTIFMHFFRRCADGSFLFGGGDALKPGISSVRTQEKIIRFLIAYMVKVFPQLECTALQYRWGGYLAMTSSRLPNVGQVLPGVFFANGYSGHGMNNSHAAGRMLADAAAGKNEDYRIFERVDNLTLPGRGYWDNKLVAVGMLAKRFEERFL